MSGSWYHGSTGSGMRRFRYRLIALAVLIAVAALAAWWFARAERRNVLVAGGAQVVTVMDFNTPFALDPPPAGWRHHRFWTRRPASFSFAVKDGVKALRVETRGSASMLFRHVDIDLVLYPLLAWRWLVEKPIDSVIDERTEQGDDHPARLFVSFRAGDGKRSMEIIWGNRLLGRGQYKYIGGFPHYVANGGASNVGRWHTEEVDLLAIYRHIWKDAGPVRVIDIAIFCDSDETGGETVSYFADVRMRRR